MLGGKAGAGWRNLAGNKEGGDGAGGPSLEPRQQQLSGGFYLVVCR